MDEGMEEVAQEEERERAPGMRRNEVLTHILYLHILQTDKGHKHREVS